MDNFIHLFITVSSASAHLISSHLFELHFGSFIVVLLSVNSNMLGDSFSRVVPHILPITNQKRKPA
jgi:hypothetical protein